MFAVTAIRQCVIDEEYAATLRGEDYEREKVIGESSPVCPALKILASEADEYLYVVGTIREACLY